MRHHAHPSSRPPLLQNLLASGVSSASPTRTRNTRAFDQHRWNLQIFNLAASEARNATPWKSTTRIDEYRAKFASSSSSSSSLSPPPPPPHTFSARIPASPLGGRRYREQRSSRRQHSSHLVRVQFWHDVESVPSKAQSALLVCSRRRARSAVRTLRVRASIQEITRSCVV